MCITVRASLSIILSVRQMNNEGKDLLIRQSARLNFVRTIKRGLKTLVNVKKKRVSALFFFIFTNGGFYYLFAMTIYNRLLPVQAKALVFGILNFSLLIMLFYAYGTVPHAREISDNFYRIGMVNNAGEVPVITNMKKDGINIAYTFYTVGFPSDLFLSNKSKLEQVFDMYIKNIHSESSKREITVTGVKNYFLSRETIYWDDSFSVREPHIAVLGTGPAGIATMNLSKGHYLVAASTGFGKTQLLVSAISQFLEKGCEVMIADWKMTGDYSKFAGRAKMLYTIPELKKALEYMNEQMQARATVLREQGLSNVLQLKDAKIKPLVLVIDETSLLLDTTGLSKDDRSEIQTIIKGLQDISRIGRATLVNIILSTQHTSADVVPTSIKSNLFRIVGHCNDVEQSLVALGTTEAATLPAVPGIFIQKDENGNSQIFKAFLKK